MALALFTTPQSNKPMPLCDTHVIVEPGRDF